MDKGLLLYKTVAIQQLVLIRARVHPFPSRTRKLSSLLPTILGWRRPGKIGSANTKEVTHASDFFFCLFFALTSFAWETIIAQLKNDGDFYDAEKRFIFALPAGGAHTRGMLENDPGIFFPDHCFLFVAAGLYDQRRGHRRPNADSAGGCGCQRYVVAHFYLFAVCLWRQRGLLRSHIL